MELTKELFSVIILLMIVIGALQCFMGYRIFKLLLGLIGFLVGGGGVGFIGYSMSQNEAVALIAGLVGGSIGALLMIALSFIGTFLIGAFLGGLLGIVLSEISGNGLESSSVFILAVLMGIMALILKKFFIIVSTGFGGAWLVVLGITNYNTGGLDHADIEHLFRFNSSDIGTLLIGWAVLGIVGVIVQYRSRPGSREVKEVSIVEET